MSLFGPHLDIIDAPEEWEWISGALGAPGTVSAIVPNRFERYIRIDHESPDRFDSQNLPIDMLEAVAGMASIHTTTPDRIWFAVWEGYGWLSAHALVARRASGGVFSRLRREKPFDEFEEQKAQLADDLRALPSMTLPSYTYRMMCGPVRAVTTMHDPLSEWARWAPDLWWPADRAWFVGSAVEATSTYVGGSEAFAKRLLGLFPGRAVAVDPEIPAV